VEELRSQLAETQETLRAIHEGEVDAVIVSGSKGEQVFSLTGADLTYRLIAETMYEAALTVTMDGRVMFCNQQLGRLLGTPQEQILGHDLASFVPPSHREDLSAILERASACSAKGRLVFVGKDGRHVPVYLSASLLQQADGPSICIVASDLTDLENSTEIIQQLHRQREDLQAANEELAATDEELQAQNEELATSRKELARSNMELEQFAQVASHDLQEPLRGIIGFLKLLEERYQPQMDDKAKDYIRYSVDAAARMSQLIKDLLTYSRVGIKCKMLEKVDSNRTLDAALFNLRGSIKEAGATVTHDDLPTVRGDVSKLTQLFQNLIGNAVKFRHADRPCHVHVSSSQQEGKWLFSVRDNGIGIAPEHHVRIFVIFQQLHGRREYPGAGIGLAICKKIVEQHGGRIWVESKVGEGSTLYFTL
jgi:PAS domain S-box-containing protein